MDDQPRFRRLTTLAMAMAIALAVAAGCGSNDAATESPSTNGDTAPGATGAPDAGEPVIDPGDGGDYAPVIDPAQFSSTIDHAFLPALPGARWRYEGVNEDGELEVIEVEVLDEYRIVMGVETIVVHDVVSIDGEVIEDTYDWFAQDAAGNVWYFGEDTTSYDEGVPDTEGAWEAGVDGALPGIVMPAEPAVSDIGYRQEYYAGEAEDMGQVIAVSGSITVPAGTFDDIVRTRDWTPLEPDVVEEKVYARDVGFVYETEPGTDLAVELIEYVPGRRPGE